jgi:TQXA domain-containing protein
MTLLSIPASPQVTSSRRVVVRPAHELPRMTRYRGGTYSHTVDRIVFADGSTARTDLIRLNPNLDAYSLDFSGIAPRLPSRYELGTWSALTHLRARGREAQIGWILRHSFPSVSTPELSRQVRAAGYPLGAANIADHEAIAATQAAIWYFTNGLALDTQPLNVPVAVRRGPGPGITYEFDGEPQIGGYSDAPVHLRLQKSTNGVDWQDISGSQLTTGATKGRYQRGLGVGSTVSSSSHGRRGRGFRYYRLVTTPPAAAPSVGHVSFWLTGTRHYRNADRVVHLYNYLLAGANGALRETGDPQLVTKHAVAEDGLVGPFFVRTPLALNVTGGHALVGPEGVAIDGPVQPGQDFYIRPMPGTSTTTLIATATQAIVGRVLTGVAADDSPHRFTPVALAVPTDIAIHFDIDWDCSCDNR